jgi:hypothetical protein
MLLLYTWTATHGEVCTRAIDRKHCEMDTQTDAQTQTQTAIVSTRQ